MSARESHPTIVLWCAPRSRSTAFARMMVERGDVRVVHEPFSHVTDFGSARIGDVDVTDAHLIPDALEKLAAHQPVFVKDTTDFRYPTVLEDTGFLRGAIHTFLIREVDDVLVSLRRLNPSITPDDLGFARLAEIYDSVTRATDRRPVVISSDDLVADPPSIVSGYCNAVGIEFLPHALTWRAGMLPEWRHAPQWHAEVSRTTGFLRPTHSAGAPIDPHDVELAELRASQVPHFHRLYEARLRIPTRSGTRPGVQ